MIKLTYYIENYNAFDMLDNASIQIDEITLESVKPLVFKRYSSNNRVNAEIDARHLAEQSEQGLCFIYSQA